jgi:hypothetical protein
MRPFRVIRNGDETGISGTGVVIEGVVFSDGTCVARWVTPTSPGRSTTIWDSFGAFVSVHVAPHPGNKTEIVFDDGEVYSHTKKSPRAKRRG